MGRVSLLFKGREWFREFHESEYDPIFESRVVEEEDPNNCQNCEHNEGCPGGCMGNKFEPKEDLSE